ncbi:DUF2087 domain-containing protein [Isoptericola variabilis]|uniref:DUF2087 domain-containing protein n=1 Tax=Isoptericola variabilis (strain 225) TaxID=743718 RepID=F6FQW3_ISOV2|nr:DUF2087 domain-containing protein [Isoptericola variabilis]AEG42928.1 Protein of unknown function DUF2087 [Isoptericola variabilis 225]TWH31822.1 hypothetical protein L600_002000000310 [Isoptericola variabilis J7]
MTEPPATGDPRRFLRDGRLESLPRRWRDKVAVTRFLATRAMPHLLEPVGERELTDRLAELADDPVGLRRAMVDLGLVRRTRDGAEYWRTELTEHDPETAVEQAIDRALGDVSEGRG